MAAAYPGSVAGARLSNGSISSPGYRRPMPFRELVSRHAMREAQREGITLEEMEDTYLDPDVTRLLLHDAEREDPSSLVRGDGDRGGG